MATGLLQRLHCLSAVCNEQLPFLSGKAHLDLSLVYCRLKKKKRKRGSNFLLGDVILARKHCTIKEFPVAALTQHHSNTTVNLILLNENPFLHTAFADQHLCNIFQQAIHIFFSFAPKNQLCVKILTAGSQFHSAKQADGAFLNSLCICASV